MSVTNAFNNLNQIVGGTWTGGVMSLTVEGGVNYHVGTVMVNNVQAEFHPDTKTFRRDGVTVTGGVNEIEAIYYGPPITNAGHIATSTVTVVLGDTAYVHDDNGNLVEDGNFHYHFDLANQLTNVVSKVTTQSVFSARYDGLNRRVEVTRNGTETERYVYFPASFNVLAVLDATNGVKELYTHGPDLSGSLGGAGGIGGILSDFRSSTSELRFYHADAMGNVVMTTDSAGEITSTHRYTPFGRPVTSTGSYQARFGFSSKEYDPETGLSYYGYRFYSPELGRWLNRDPIGERGGLNLYEFVGNAPLFSVDYLGLQRRDCPMMVVAGHFGHAQRDVERLEERERLRSTYRACSRTVYRAASCFASDRGTGMVWPTPGARQIAIERGRGSAEDDAIADLLFRQLSEFEDDIMSICNDRDRCCGRIQISVRCLRVREEGGLDPSMENALNNDPRVRRICQYSNTYRCPTGSGTEGRFDRPRIRDLAHVFEFHK